MAKKYIDLRLKDIDVNGIEKVVTYKYRMGPRAAHIFLQEAKMTPTPENMEKLGISGLVYMIYAGCKPQHPELTVERVWELVDNYEIDELGEITEQIAPKVDDPNA